MTKSNNPDNSYAGYETWKQWDQKGFGAYSRKEHHYFSQIFKRFVPNKCKDILEIGFGNGAFAGWLKATHPNISWSGIEKQEVLISKAKRAGFEAQMALPDSTLKGRHDLIIALDVVEHLTDIEVKHLFTQAEAILKPNGLILIRTPNGAGPFGLPNQTGDATHITPICLSRLSGYLPDWDIEETGDVQPIWTGNLLSATRNTLRFALRITITGLIRFAFAPQPTTLLASNLHLIFRKR